MKVGTSELDTEEVLQFISIWLVFYKTLGNYQPNLNWKKDLVGSERFY